MNWFFRFFASSIGKKLVMSLTGLFLCSFLIIHLLGNLQLFANDGGQAFNTYAKFMVSNPLIKFISIGLYIMIILHAVLGISLYIKNRAAKGQVAAVGYKSEQVTWASRNMASLGILIFAFLLIHMGDFWFKMKFGSVDTVNYGAGEVKDLYSKVQATFSNIGMVIAYLVGLLALSLHLMHGFESGFQTLGWNHKKYTPIIKAVGFAFAILIPLGYAILPLYFKFFL